MIVSRLLRTRRSGLAALSIVLMLAITSQRVSAAGLGCVFLYNGPIWQQYNLDTGETSEVAKPPGVYQDMSPNNKLGAYTTPNGADAYNTNKANLQISGGGHVSTVRIVAPKSDTRLELIWTSDNAWLTYFWHDMDGKAYLGIADYNGYERKLITFDLKPSETIELSSLYHVDHYLSVLVHHVDGSQSVTFFAIPTLARAYVIDGLPPVERCPDYRNCTEWSPQAHRIAYIVRNNGLDQLWIVSPADQSRQVFNFSLQTTKLVSSPNEQFLAIKLIWSPDEQFLAMFMLEKESGTYSTRIFDVKQNTLKTIADNIPVTLDSLTRGDFFLNWSKDSASLYYLQETVQIKIPGEIYSAQLMAFRIANQQIDTLAMVTKPPVYSPDLKYALIEWLDGAQLYTGVVNLHDGQKKVLFEGGGSTNSMTWQRNGALAWVLASDSSGGHIVWADADGSNSHQIDVPGSPREWAYSNITTFPEKSSKRLVLTKADTSYSLLLIDLSAVSYNEVASTDHDVEFLWLSPDQQNFVFLSGFTSYLVPLDTQKQPIELSSSNTYQAFSWSADGSMLIYYSSDTPGGGAVDIFSRDGKLLHHFDNVPVSVQDDFYLSWGSCQTTN